MRTGTTTLASLATCLPLIGSCTGTAPAPHAVPADLAATKVERPALKVDPAVEQRGREALRQAGVAGDAKLVSAEPVQWNDSSLGCRQRGVQYTPVITAGHLLQFSVADRKGGPIAVHVAGESAIVCSPSLGTGVRQRAPTATRALGLDKLVEDARQDLAQRLGIDVQNVRSASIAPSVWDDTQLECGAPPRPEQVSPVRGYRILFATPSGNFAYHLDGDRFAPCPAIAAQ